MYVACILKLIIIKLIWNSSAKNSLIVMTELNRENKLVCYLVNVCSLNLYVQFVFQLKKKNRKQNVYRLWVES